MQVITRLYQYENFHLHVPIPIPAVFKKSPLPSRQNVQDYSESGSSRIQMLRNRTGLR